MASIPGRVKKELQGQTVLHNFNAFLLPLSEFHLALRGRRVLAVGSGPAARRGRRVVPLEGSGLRGGRHAVPPPLVRLEPRQPKGGKWHDQGC